MGVIGSAGAQDGMEVDRPVPAGAEPDEASSGRVGQSKAPVAVCGHGALILIFRLSTLKRPLTLPGCRTSGPPGITPLGVTATSSETSG